MSKIHKELRERIEALDAEIGNLNNKFSEPLILIDSINSPNK